MPKLKIYTTPTCVYCHALLDWLDELGVEYEEVNAENLSNMKSVPVTEICLDSNKVERIVGFDRPAIKKLLKAASLI